LTEARDRSPLGRLVTADEVAFAAQFLCSSASQGIIGHTLVIDGGTRIVE
jgi:enoyl-[acyl-carrier protein] reductase III